MVTDEQMIAATKAYAGIDGKCRPAAMRAALEAALSASDAEPACTVAEIGAGGYRMLAPYPLDAINHLPVGTPLYAAPPAPAVSVKGLAGGLATACALARIKYGNLDDDVDAELTRLEALSVSALNTSPEPAVFTVEQIIAKIEDYGQDSLPGSEYRQACDDLIEEFSGESSQRVPEPAAKAVPKGWQLVPVEPTLDMLEAGFHPTVNGPFVDHAWKAMLAAAPEVPRHD